MLHEKFFPDMEIVSLSGNFCTDKKPSAVNWYVVLFDQLRTLSLTLTTVNVINIVINIM